MISSQSNVILGPGPPTSHRSINAASSSVAKAVSPVELCMMVVWWGHILVSSECFQLLPDSHFSLKRKIFLSRIRVNISISTQEVYM